MKLINIINNYFFFLVSDFMSSQPSLTTSQPFLTPSQPSLTLSNSYKIIV